ncbi:hypothetical protein JB92DRAFT_2848117, partial [Gautieria morchelliformis]
MAQTTAHPKHDIHKFCDIKPKLDKENWMSWKRELLATMRDRGIFKTITGVDPYHVTANQQITVVAGINMVGSTASQILLCISPKLQTAIDTTDQCTEAWTILTRKFESTDPSKISIIRTKYENYHM